MSESILGVIAASWGVAMGASPLLQIRQMLRTRSSRDVSVPYFLILNVGFLLWFAYGVSISNLAVAVPNVVAFTVGSLTIAVAWRLRRGEDRSASPSTPGVPEIAGQPTGR